ncbi:hypothetical protein [Psychromarinibacter sp. S121]|uniref:hypothetical protein n=1 Tax=Psychromarinibacter sp. S121 TaxID=3415127 RepID=UPI003C7AA195
MTEEQSAIAERAEGWTPPEAPLDMPSQVLESRARRVRAPGFLLRLLPMRRTA